MRFSSTLYGAWLLCGLPLFVRAVATTDEYRDADEKQSSYLPNHNMDPNVVGSTGFGTLWSKGYNTGEIFFAKPLTFTSAKSLNGGKQVVILASNANNIYIEDAKAGGTIPTIAKRFLGTAFTQADTGNCPDIPGSVGVIGTPAIDPATEYMYFFSKSYKGTAQGLQNGVYHAYGIDLNSPTLADIPGFPVLIDGAVADNDPTIYFVGGSHNQRPSVILRNNVLYGAFGAVSRAVIGVSIAQAKVITYFSTEVSPWLPAGRLDMTQSSGGAGIWMGGAGLASDSNSRLFFSTGNGKGKENTQGGTLSGAYKLDTLSECAINLAINADGTLSLQDYFQPFDYAQYDNYDEDLGSAGISLLDPGTFSGGGVTQMALTYGKNNIMYVLNANNLGGFGQGASAQDRVIQTINAGASTFGGSGSYPLEGGYIYFVPSNAAIQAYKLTFLNGVPQFAYAGQSSFIINGRIGPPVVTSLNGQAGSGILWVADNNAGLLAFNAVPVGGTLQQIKLPPTGGLQKFQRASFGDGRVYTTNANGVVYCMGSPVNSALNCTAANFGNVPIGSSGTTTVTCTALTAITSINYMVMADAQFTASNSSLPTGNLAVGAKFTFPVKWNPPSTTPATVTSSIKISLTPASNMFSNSFPVAVSGQLVSQNAFVSVSPANLIFSPVIIGSATESAGSSSSFVIANSGLSNLTILGYYYSIDGGSTTHNVTLNSTDSTLWNVGNGVNLQVNTLPAIGSQLAPGSSSGVAADFFDIFLAGTYSSAFYISTNGGIARVTFSGTASAQPTAEVTISNGEGGWDAGLIQDFGPLTATPGNSAQMTMRVCNSGGSNLEVTKSKPVATAYFTTDIDTAFPEGQLIAPGSCSYSNITFTPGSSYINTAAQEVFALFVLNFNDPSYGDAHYYNFTGSVVPVQVGPLLGTGMAKYQYSGCYHDSVCGASGNLRCLSTSLAVQNNNAVTCIQACQNAGYAVAAPEYHTECWCGKALPPASTFIDNTLGSQCTYVCPGDTTGGLQHCGGDGTLMNLYYDTTRLGNNTSSSSSSSSTAATSTPIVSTTTGTGLTTTTATSSSASASATIVGNYAYMACYTEGNGIRALNKLSTATNLMTVEYCQAYCNGYTYFGVEYGRECYCGNAFMGGSAPAANQASCSLPCANNAAEKCGAGNFLNVYQKVVASSSSSSSTLSSTSSSLPVPISTSLSSTSTSSSSASTSTSSTSSSSVSTSTSSTSSSSSTSSTSTTSTSISVSSTSSSASSTATIVGGYTYIGCYTEATNIRALSKGATANNQMTVEACQSFCSGLGWSMFGVEYARECYCGNSLNTGSILAANQGDCSMACDGNSAEKCGAGNRLNVYSKVAASTTSSTTVTSSPSSVSSSITSSSPLSTTTSSTSIVLAATTSSSSITSITATSTSNTIPSSTSSASSIVPTTMITTTSSSTSSSAQSTSSTSIISGYASLGCYAEPAGPRQWVRILANNNMNVELCLSAAKAHSPSYSYVGLEYGIECWAAMTTFSHTTLTAKGACTMSCSGNPTENCGGNNAFQYYTATATGP